MNVTSLSMQSTSFSRNHDKIIATWLLLICATIFAMVVVGGVTRLTGSGLSMVQWEPIVGAIPPLSQAEWESTFHQYQQFPEFQFKNPDMDVEGFKNIFWLEYFHRLLGRGIGVLFFIPMLYFFIRGYVSKELKPKLITMFILGGLQGALGWYMVSSGLADDAHVSQYRLTAHLGLAIIIYGYIFWVALGLLFPRTELKSNRFATLGTYATAIVALAYVTILSGGFVAGLRAGFVYNTFPLMEGQWIHNDILALDPLWRNFFENFITVQFDHRILALTVLASILAFWWTTRRINLQPRARLGMNLLLAAVLLQIALGITTLLLIVPIPLAAAHQGGAVLLFTAALFVTHALRRQ